MGKRKGVPKRADEEKRQCMTWNMLDSNAQPTLHILSNEDTKASQEVRSEEEASTSQHKLSPVSSDFYPNDPHTVCSKDLAKLIDFCDFYLSVYGKLQGDSTRWHSELGRFTLQLDQTRGQYPIQLPESEQFWFYVSEENTASFVYFELEENDENNIPISVATQPFHYKARTALPYGCLEGLCLKHFQLVSTGYDPDRGEMGIAVYILESLLTKPQFPSEGVRLRKNNCSLQRIMKYFYGIEYTESPPHTKKKKEDIDKLYEVVQEKHKVSSSRDIEVKLNVQHKSLVPVLRPYQKQAVLWMLSRERYGQENVKDDSLHNLYKEITTLDGQKLYYNPHGGILTQQHFSKVVSPPGGILADEMGLGKTVEVLACMLSHPRTDLPPQEKRPVQSHDSNELTRESDVSNSTSPHPEVEGKQCNYGNQMKTENLPETSVPLAAAVEDAGHENSGSILASPVCDSSVLADTGKQCNYGNQTKTENLPETSLPLAAAVEDAGHENSGSILASPSVCDISVLADHDYLAHGATENQQQQGKSQGSFEQSAIEAGPHRDAELCVKTTLPLVGKSDSRGSADIDERDIDAISGSSQPGLQIPLVGIEGIKASALSALEHSVVEGSSKSADPLVYGNTDLESRGSGGDNGMQQGEKVLSNGGAGGDIEISQGSDSQGNHPTKDTKSTDHSISNRDPGTKDPLLLDPKEGDSSTHRLENNLFNISDQKPDCIADGNDSSSAAGVPGNAQSSISIVGLLDSKGEDSTAGSVLETPTGSTVTNGARKPSKRKKRVFVETVEIDDAPEPANAFTELPIAQKKYFECICGKKGHKRDDKERLQCEKCGLFQHPECVNYDVNDQYRGIYKCPHCHVSSPPIPSGATLIISPNSICHQWVEEIKKHVKEESLNLFVYTGVHKQGFIQPQTLANCDIVITSYETLRKEINYVDLPHSNSEAGRRFRHPKRFMAIPSPIIAVEWWRICLDEAQMVECTTTKTAEMALRLSAVNRWCVTGTPIQRYIADLYGLLLFLGVDPYWVQCWWTKLLYEPYHNGDQQPLLDVVSRVLWRTAKKDVIEQIGLPTQRETIHWLTFSPVEEHFYRGQFKNCVQEAMKKLGRWTESNMLLSSLDRYTMHGLLHPLLRLRQACCHPQAVKGEFLPLHKTTMTMEELLKSLIKKTKVECEEAHRQQVAAMNGLAGLSIIKEEFSDAVEMYREVLRSVDEHKDQLRTDSLQQLHAMHNLREVLSQKHSGIPPTLRDDQLLQQSRDIREHYMAKVAVQVTDAQDTWLPHRNSLRQLQQEFRDGRMWWSAIIQWTVYIQMDDVLIAKVKDDLAENASPELTSISRRFRELRGLQYILQAGLEQLETSHTKLVTALQRLSGDPSQETINTTVECCLRPAAEIKKDCPFCKANELFDEYESKLYSFVDKGVYSAERGEAGESAQVQVNTKRSGTWADSEVEKVLKSLISFAKTYGGDRDLLANGGTHLKIFEALKKEFRSLRSVWMSLREQIAAIDELDMCTMRLRLRLPGEERTDPPQLNVIEEGEIEQQRLKNLSDRAIARTELRKKLGQLLYLGNLSKAQDGLKCGSNPEPCPICQKKLGSKWSVLLCGHCYCLSCVQILVERYSFGGHRRSFKCPMCRQKVMHSEISYVSTKAKESESTVAVKGDNSTKVEGIIQCLMEIQQKEPGAKSLVFSTWHDILDVIATALQQNNIGFRSLHASHKFQLNLATFRHSEDVPVLLLPVHSGANGLNLIEATHVLLVEPILNSSQEMQAIGRVHRIGQTRSTMVHRFLVKGTIEEKMHVILQSVKAPMNSHDTEGNTLTIGDLAELFKDTQPEEEEGEEEEDEDGDLNNLVAVQ